MNDVHIRQDEKFISLRVKFDEMWLFVESIADESKVVTWHITSDDDVTKKPTNIMQIILFERVVCHFTHGS